MPRSDKRQYHDGLAESRLCTVVDRGSSEHWMGLDTAAIEEREDIRGKFRDVMVQGFMVPTQIKKRPVRMPTPIGSTGYVGGPALRNGSCRTSMPCQENTLHELVERAVIPETDAEVYSIPRDRKKGRNQALVRPLSDADTSPL